MSDEEIPPFPPHKMSVFSLVMINIAAMVALINLPESATYGISAIFYYLFAILVFLLPVALVSAELATGWAKHGGVYIWVKEALGPHWGFLAIFLQWIQIVFFYPTILTFAAIAFVFYFNPAVATSTSFTTKLYIYLFILIVFWGATFLNFRGMKLSSRLSTIGVVFGILIPGAILILLAGLSLALGNGSQTSLAPSALIRQLNNLTIIIFALGILFTFAGLEMSASHAEEVHNPQKNYPIAILVTVLIVAFLMTAGSVAISIVVPKSKLALSAGLMQAFKAFLVTFNVPWLLPFISLLLILGVFGLITAWIVGPTKGLLAVSRHGFLPPFFQKINKNHIPTTILIIQAILVSIVSLLIFIAPQIDTAFWILSALAIQSYLIMYALLFITGIRLRYTEPKVHRDFKIPFGNLGMNVVAGVGIAAAVGGLLVGFIPPFTLSFEGNIIYALTLFIVLVIVCAIPLSVYYLRRDSWDTDPDDKKGYKSTNTD